MKIRLQVSDDNDYGLAGLSVNSNPANMPDMGEGYLLAHDIVEHVNGLDKIGGIEDELEALGAIWVVRGQHCDIRRPHRSIYSPEQSIASDVVEVMRHWHGRKLRFNRTNAYIHDESFDYILSTGVADMSIASECDHLTPEQRHKFLVAAKHLMRTGARKLCRKFYHHSRLNPDYAANTLFYNIVEAVEDKCKQMEVGQTFELQIMGLDARIIEVYPEYE